MPDCKLIEYYPEPGSEHGLTAIEFPGSEIFLLVNSHRAWFTTQPPFKTILLAPFEISLDQWSRVRFLADTMTATQQALADATQRCRELRAAIAEDR